MINYYLSLRAVVKIFEIQKKEFRKKACKEMMKCDILFLVAATDCERQTE